MKKLLVLDEDPRFLRTIREALEHTYSIICAASKRDATEKMEQERPALLIVGYLEPRGAAFTFCREAPQQAAGGPIPLLIVDVGPPEYARLGWRREDVLAIKAVAYLVRPVPAAELRREVGRALASGGSGLGGQQNLMEQVEDVLRRVEEIERMLAR